MKVSTLLHVAFFFVITAPLTTGFRAEARMNVRVDIYGATQSLVTSSIQFNLGSRLSLGPTFTLYPAATSGNAYSLGLRSDIHLSNGIFKTSPILGWDGQYLLAENYGALSNSLNLGFSLFLGSRLNLYFGAKGIFFTTVNGSSLFFREGFFIGLEGLVGIVLF